jgi:hypothetical protein
VPMPFSDLFETLAPALTGWGLSFYGRFPEPSGGV